MLYADDVLLYLAEPAVIIPCLKEIISEFGHYSGYKVNLDKTEAVSIGCKIPQQILSEGGCKWPKEGIRYLGIHIPPSLQKLYDVNYKKIIRNISSDIDRWIAFPLSLLGHIESIRMNVLPWLLYPFQMLPIGIPKSTFNNTTDSSLDSSGKVSARESDLKWKGWNGTTLMLDIIFGQHN